MGIREELQKRYKKCLLLKIKLKKNPVTDPYSSEYKVRKIFLKDIDAVRNYIAMTDDTDPDYLFCRYYLGLLLLYVGCSYLDTEETSEGINYLMQCLDYIKSPLDPYFVLPSLIARNELGLAYFRLSKREEAIKYFKEAESLYHDFKSLIPAKEAVFIVESLREKDIEEIHTTTHLFLAQVYGLLKHSIKSAVHCHKTLKRQLRQKNFDSIDWALNVLKLSDFFLDKMLFKQVRNHLAAAIHILDEYENSLESVKGSQEEIDAKKEEFRQRSADLAWCWAKYGLCILQYSRYKLSDLKDGDVEEKYDDLEKLYFDELDLTRYENQITATNVVTFEEAREVFLFSQRHYNKAKEYYTLEDRASVHIQIVQGHSSLFRQLSAFEPDKGRQFLMLKKRANMLEAVAKELNPRYYKDLCLQLWFELGEVYQDMAQIKYEKSENAPSAEAARKINLLIELSMKNFNQFLDSVKDEKTGELPDPIEDNLIESTLSALFYLGRLNFKYFTQDERVLVEKAKKAQEYFKYLMEVCDKNESAKALVDEKYELSKEMVELLQMRILQLQFFTAL